jgi:hypothetical protein
MKSQIKWDKNFECKTNRKFEVLSEDGFQNNVERGKQKKTA